MPVANNDLYLRSTTDKTALAANNDLYLRSNTDKSNLILPVDTNTITITAPSASRGKSIASVVWMESGTDATQDTSFFSSSSGTITSATDQSYTGGRALKLTVNSTPAGANARKTGIVVDDGARISMRVRFSTVANTVIFSCQTGANQGVVAVDISSGKLLARPAGATSVAGTTALDANQWYRIGFSYNVRSTTDYELRIYLDGVLECTANAGTLARTGIASLLLQTSVGFGAGESIWFDDIYVDNGTDLTDPGDIRITAKRPNANGGLNTFDTTTSTTNSGYGTGNAIYVNEQPLATTGARRHNGTGTADENFAIENAATGDVNLTGKTIKGRLSWVHASGVITDTIYNNGTTVAPDSAFTGTAGIRYAVSTSNAYPSSSSAVGMGRPVGNATNAILNEAGMLIAYAAASSASLSADTNTITVTAPTATKSSGTSSKSAGTNTVTVTASEETQSEATKLNAGINIIVVSSPTVGRVAQIYVTSGTNTITISAPAITIQLYYSCVDQFSSTTNTISNGGWSASVGVDLSAMINDGLAIDTSTYIQSGLSPYEDTAKFNIAELITPATSNVTIAIWVRKADG